MARSKQGSIVQRGKRLYARIRWIELADGQKVTREKFKRVTTRTEGRAAITQMLRELEDHGPQIFDGAQLTFRALAALYASAKLTDAEYSGDTKIAGLRSPKTAQAQLAPLIAYFGD